MRANIRILVFVAVFATVVGYPVLAFVQASASGGVSRASDHWDVDLKAMTNFDLDPQSGTTADVPARWRAMDGKRVALCGEMLVPGAADGSAGERFDLVYSISKCCQFGGVQLRQHFVNVRVPAGAGQRAYLGLVRATGVLHVRVDHEGGRVARAFTLDLEKLDPL